MQKQKEEAKANKSVDTQRQMNSMQSLVPKVRSLSQDEIQILQKHKGKPILYEQTTQVEEKYFIKKKENE